MNFLKEVEMIKSKIARHIKSHGLTLTEVAAKAGVTRQALAQYGEEFSPTLKTLTKVAKAMTELGVETTAADLVKITTKYADET